MTKAIRLKMLASSVFIVIFCVCLSIFAGLPSFAEESGNVIYGDVDCNGKVDLDDLILLRKYLANYDYDTDTSTVTIGIGSDVNDDRNVDLDDVLLIREYFANYDYDGGFSSVVLGPRETTAPVTTSAPITTAPPDWTNPIK